MRRATDLPLLVKLTPSAGDIVGVARAVQDAGADALTLINTFPAMRIDIQARRPALGWGAGGLSGPALRPIAVRMVYLVSQAVDVPVVGCGGIMSGEDAVEMMMAGAAAVQVGTATFLNPSAALEVIEGIESFLRANGFSSPREIVGLAHPGRAEGRHADRVAAQRIHPGG